MSVAAKVGKLRSLVRLLTEASETIIQQWETEDSTASTYDPNLPSAELWDARRTMTGACGMCIDLVQEPAFRLLEIATGHNTSRALHIAAEAGIADVLAHADPTKGMSVQEISAQVGIEARKLARILRCLCSIHIFTEVKDLSFANSPTSQILVDNEPFRCLVNSSEDMYAASVKLPAVLFDPVKTYSYSPREAAFQETHQTSVTFWEYLESTSDRKGPSGKGPSAGELFNLAMVGASRFFAPGLCAGLYWADSGSFLRFQGYPWAALGSATVVDVGSGVGSLCLALAHQFQDLRFVLQDRASVIAQAGPIWQRELPDAVAAGRVSMFAHDFFAEQQVKNADVYFLRHILHDWPDDECVVILQRLRDAMGTNSRLLVADHIIHPTIGSEHLKQAPAPLLPNYGSAHLAAHNRDLDMMMLLNGSERTPEQFGALAERAGLKLIKLWECRSLVSIIEMRKAESI